VEEGRETRQGDPRAGRRDAVGRPTAQLRLHPAPDLLEDFTSRFGRPFSARLILKENGRHGFEFLPRRARDRAGGSDFESPSSPSRVKRRKKAAKKKTAKKKTAAKKKGSKKSAAEKRAGGKTVGKKVTRKKAAARKKPAATKKAAAK
jgi:hypothetical protein